MRKRDTAIAGLLALVTVITTLSLSSRPGEASQLEKWLIMPGEVIAGHADIEDDCDACHAPLSDQPQGALCIDCHVDIGADLSAREGFHGRVPEHLKLECADCHAEHEGRELMRVDLDATGFDHANTDFALVGAHARLDCASCHEPAASFRDAASDCVGCHENDDVHDGRLGQDCAGCHGAAAWTNARFDHATTAFPLNGGHAGVECASCHTDATFTSAGTDCVACHRGDDVHRGRNGDQCADCHTVSNWQSSTFNHLSLTGFPLMGGHRNLSCQDCHRSPEFTDLGNSSCASCHAGDDAHDGHFGLACGSCHESRDWQTADFDHASRTGFALPAGHAELACGACHNGPAGRELPADCAGCHAAEDVHDGQLGSQCASCHVATDWTAQLFFDHDITSFPLLGAHADTACGDCHASQAFLDAGEACIDCHADDDVHKEALGTQCDSCHNPAGWPAWQFDHALLTGFALTGAHAAVACTDCHTEPLSRAKPLGDSCRACHARDDPHRGRFGNDCKSCHSTSSFRDAGGAR